MKEYKDGKYTHRVSVVHRDNKLYETDNMTNLFVKTFIIINNKKYVHLYRVLYDKPAERKVAMQVAYKINKDELRKMI